MTTAELRLPPPPEQGKWASIGLTAFVHGILLLVLFFGVRWQTRPPEAVEVELIREVPIQSAALRAAQPEPEPEPVVEPRPVPKAAPKPLPEPEPKVAPKAEPKPQPKPRPEPVAKPVSKPAPAKPDIALKDKQPPKPQPKPEPKPAPKAEAKPAVKPAVKSEPKAPPKPEKKPAAKPEPSEHLSHAEEAQRSKLLDDELRRDSQRLAQAKLQGEAEREMAALQKQRAAAASARSLEEWKGKIRQKIRGNIVVPPGVEGNPEVVVDVSLLPTGGIIDRKVRRSSGNSALDAAILRAIDKSNPLPKPEQGPVERELSLKFRPLED
jgi:colicin import membrane protein